MGLYGRYVLPRLVDHMCGLDAVAEQRARLVPLAEGRVLEVGFGSGRNLPWYDPDRVERLFGLDPAEEMLALARQRSAAVRFPVEHLALAGEEIPLGDASVDTVVVTFTLCTMRDPERALEGMRRALRPTGRLIFVEHGRAPDPGLARWQRRVNPLWSRAFGGCHLDRDVPGLIAAGGFRLDALESEYAVGAPRIAAFGYRGVARPR